MIDWSKPLVTTHRDGSWWWQDRADVHGPYPSLWHAARAAREATGSQGTLLPTYEPGKPVKRHFTHAPIEDL